MTKFYTLLLLITAILASISNVSSQTNIAGGNVSGTWTLAGSPYLINGSIQIPNGQTLTIEPGVTVNFQGSYKFYIQGCLLAVGNESDMITFTASDTVTGWLGVRFESTPSTNDSSKLFYCNIKNGNAFGSSENARGGALYFKNFSKAIIKNCKIFNNKANDFGGSGGAIYCSASGISIINNYINNNSSRSGGGIYCSGSSSPLIENNFIFNNSSTYSGGAIYVGFNTSLIVNNILYNNSSEKGGGIYFWTNDNDKIINNLIVNNSANSGGGIYCYNGSSPTFYNCNFYGNTATISGNQIYLDNEDSDPNFYNCNLSGNTSDFGLNGNFYLGTYQNNIDSDPLFVAPTAGSGTAYDGTTADWSLQAGSPCINAGTTDTTGLNLPSTDIAGNPRVSNGRIDIGAYEHLGTSINNPITNNLINIYPNPNNGKFLLYLENYESKNYSLEIYDITGQIVYSKNYENTVVLAENIVLSKFESGVYLVKITDGESVFRRNVVVFK